ncbi:MAG: GNAT family N-acetyltransferase [Candidatus Obscuribacterales bacterium]|nr:GNAT family N-acetyltransferase [Candidatus Obscuribacterales bacterium]
MIQLDTERLLLREFVKADWTQIHVYAKDPDVVRYMEWGPNSKEDTLDFIDASLACQKERPRRIYEFAALLKGTDILIGACGIRIAESDPMQAEIGYCFNKDFWGKGFASEAAAKIVEFGFKNLGLHRVTATCDVDNKGSAAVLEKLGMRREGHFIQDKKIKGTYRDTYFYATLGLQEAILGGAVDGGNS